MAARSIPGPASAAMSVCERNSMIDFHIVRVGVHGAGVFVAPAACDDSAAARVQRGRDERFLDEYFLPRVLAVAILVNPLRPVVAVVGRQRRRSRRTSGIGRNRPRPVARCGKKREREKYPPHSIACTTANLSGDATCWGSRGYRISWIDANYSDPSKSWHSRPSDPLPAAGRAAGKPRS